ncbi:meta-pathway of phenol degradation family protein [Neisseria meningitidis]|uniref:meta-pathway of phenol degradation family protein n=1 Tax=Neisseria meningitidis TaxID=487 RepID=UPI00097A5228|nr:meta-pathway of phenol degradation family protein [Neisseria meningitidis]MBW3885053.1 meta-pathway of phenol degradation family protein [Neisseria meningitidis]MBW3897599.1 meta-pathway of phenol degradation family protein [Neisseria meningitidis]MBW3899232.1 meta-pathway of phenol degradation family protein [Neisseria meningitidis]MBW3905331.1 meta-pathway of phenol degradation family protein [Neisseria meningitidis]MBW3911675.1 meta-pathway of phenol degradation family protein [Neisseria
MKRIFLSALPAILPLSAYADLPLTIEDIMTDKGKWKLETSLTYLNSENSRAALAAPVYIQTGATSFIPIPTEIQENGSNTDMLAGTLGLRYGLTGNTDIYGSGSYLWHEERKLDGNGKTRNKRMSDISAGISHTFLKDDKNPALIGFLESTVYEKSRNKASSGKSWLIGATTYKAIDPVVLSLTAAYRINGSKTLSSNTKYKAGNYWMLNPNISFAANDRISLTGGIQWLGKQPDRLDGKKESARNTSTYAHFGAGFGFTKTTALNASARFNVSGQSSSELKFGVQHTF